MADTAGPTPDESRFHADQVNANAQRRAADPLFANIEIREGETPADLSERHDDYLYGES